MPDMNISGFFKKPPIALCYLNHKAMNECPISENLVEVKSDPHFNSGRGTSEA